MINAQIFFVKTGSLKSRPDLCWQLPLQRFHSDLRGYIEMASPYVCVLLKKQVLGMGCQLQGIKSNLHVLNSVKLSFVETRCMFSCVCVLLIQCPALCWTMPLQRIWQRSEKREKMIGQCFQYFCIGVFLIISCFTYDQLFVGRCHFKDFWSEGSRKRDRESEAFIFCVKCVWSQCQREEKSTFWWKLNGFWAC